MNDSGKGTPIETILKFFKTPLEATLCFLLVSIVLVTFIQVIFRYIIHTSLAWTEELARFFFLWLASLTSAYAFKTRSHFALRFMVDRFNKKAQALVNNLIVSITSIFLILFIWKAFEYTWSMAGQVAPSTQISMAVPYSSAIVGGLLMLYYVLKNWLDDRNPETAKGEVK